MQVTEFRSKIKPNIRLSVDGKDFVVREVVKFRFDDGSFYIKCFLSDEYVFADDLNEDMFLLVKEAGGIFTNINRKVLWIILISSLILPTTTSFRQQRISLWP